MTKETILFDEEGKAIATEHDNHSVNYPLSHSFEHVNSYVNDPAVHFEELQGLCLGLATELSEYTNPKNWIRSFNAHGDLIDEKALYKPRLK